MPLQHVTVEVITPSWCYCNKQHAQDKNYKTNEYCRFCQEVKERGKPSRYVCLLFNVDLMSNGEMVSKSELCYMKWKKNRIVAAQPIETIKADSVDVSDVSKMVKKSIRNICKDTTKMVNKSIAVDAALDVAMKRELQRW